MGLPVTKRTGATDHLAQDSKNGSQDVSEGEAARGAVALPKGPHRTGASSGHRELQSSRCG
jgi:hypothetical protein